MSNFAKYENLQALFTAIGKKKLSVSDTMPTAGATYEDICVLYIGPTDANYTKGYVYECEEVTPSTDPKTYSWNAKINVDVDLSKYKTIFPGTKDEWDALTQAQQDQYDYCFFDDDESDYYSVVDNITEGDMHPVTSNATYRLKQTVEQNIDAIADISNVYGAKNLLNHDIKSGEQSGLTFTVNADRSITVNGTASANLVFTLWNKHDLDSTKQYTLSGCPSGGADNKYLLTYTDGGYNHYDDIGSGVKFTPFTTGNDKIFLYIFSGQTFNNAVFKPMLRLASITNGTYEPYAKTNRQLTVGLENKADKVSNATNGNFAGLDANGNLTDSGKKASDFASSDIATTLVNYINENGAINQFDITLSNTKSVNTGGTWSGNAFTYRGLTYTVNADNIVITGTPTDNSFFYLLATNIPAGRYTLGGLKDAANIVWDGGFWIYNGSVETAISTGAAGNKNDFTVDLSSYTFDRIKFGIKRKSNTLTNDTIKLFIRKADINIDVNAPYAKTNRELTKDVANIMPVVNVSGVSIFDIISDLNSYPAKTEYYGYSASITNGSSTLGSLLNTGDYGVVSIKKYSEWHITISIISGNSNGKTHMACTNKNNTSIKFVNNDPAASTDKVTSTTINKAT